MTKALFKRMSVLLSLPLLAMTAGLDSSQEKSLCRGIIEDHNWQIPITLFQVGGLSERAYNQVLDQFEDHFKPVVSRMGGRLNLKRLWSNSTVNASATRSGNTYTINMYGGLARHPAITKDGLMLVACHELGHHIGGAPKSTGGGWWGGNEWASIEGQSDYYATLRCLREVWTAQENFAWYEGASIDPLVKESCELTWNTQEEEQLCMRSSMAGRSVAFLFRDLRYESKSPRFDSPDKTIVSYMEEMHPATQCRLDTYFQGALCVHDTKTKLSDSNPKYGTCNGNYDDARNGSRPRCWYRPAYRFL